MVGHSARETALPGSGTVVAEEQVFVVPLQCSSSRTIPLVVGTKFTNICVSRLRTPRRQEFLDQTLAFYFSWPCEE